MKTKHRLNIILTIATVIALGASMIFGLTGATKVKASQADGVKKLTLESDGTAAVQADTAIAVGEKQYVEMIFDFENMPSEAVVDLAFSKDRARVLSEINSGLGESLTLYADPGWIRGQLSSATAKYLTSGWGNRGDVNTLTGLQWVNGNSALGANNVADTHSYRLKYRVYSDGTLVCFFANVGETNYFNGAMAGYIHNGAAWVKDDGVTIAEKVFPTLRIRNCSAATISYYETAVYNYENACNGADFLDGTLVEGTKYVETFDVATTELRIISGTAKVVAFKEEYKTIADYTVSEDLIDASVVNGINFAPNEAGQIVSVFGEKLTLASGRYAEATYDLSGVQGSWFESKFVAQKPTDAASFGYESGEGMLVINEGRAKVYSDNATNWVCGWGIQRAVGGNNYVYVNYANGNGALGIASGSDSLRFRVRIYDDGSAIYYVAAAGQENWFGFAYVGWKHNGTAWVKDVKGFSPLNEGYFTLGFRNTAAPKLTAFTAGVYNYDAAQGEAAGTLVGELYTEKFGADTKTATVTGKGTIVDLAKAMSANGENDKITFVADGGKIVIDNAAEKGYVYSRFTLPENVTSLMSEFSLEISELVGEGKAVVYLGADDINLTNAAKLTFSLNGEGKVVISDGTNFAATDIKVGEKFKLAVVGKETNKVLLNGKEVENLSVGNVTGKYFAIGLNGVSASDKAKIAYYGVTLKGVEISSSESEFAPAIKPYPTKLAAPVISIDENGVASWVAVANAIGYKYVIDNGEETVTADLSVTLTKNQTIKVKAVGDGEDYLDGDYSAEATYVIEPVKLATVVVTIDENGVASWTAVANASGYKYVIDNGEETATADLSVTLTENQTIKVKAVGDGENYSDGEYSEVKTYVKAEQKPEQKPDSSNEENAGCFGSVSSVSTIILAMVVFGIVFAIRRKRT